MTNESLPSEFAAFVRDVAKRSFDTLADRVSDLETPIRGIVRSWGKLSAAAKDKLLDHLIGAARGEEIAPPASKPSKKTAVKRYQPEEVEKTLPAKPKKKGKKKGPRP